MDIVGRLFALCLTAYYFILTVQAECQALKVVREMCSEQYAVPKQTISENCEAADLDLSAYSHNFTGADRLQTISSKFGLYDSLFNTMSHSTGGQPPTSTRTIVVNSSLVISEETSDTGVSWGFQLSTDPWSSSSTCLLLPQSPKPNKLSLTISEQKGSTSRKWEFSEIPTSCGDRDDAEITVNLTQYVKELRSNDQTRRPRNLTLAVQVQYPKMPEPSETAPALLHEEEPPPRKVRDEQPCSPSSYCCAKPVVVRMDHIGLNGVIEPRNYSSHVCMGYCGLTSPLQQLVVDGVSMRPCCVPVEYLPLDVLYIRSDTNSVAKETLPNMRVNQCACV